MPANMTDLEYVKAQQLERKVSEAMYQAIRERAPDAIHRVSQLLNEEATGGDASVHYDQASGAKRHSGSRVEEYVCLPCAINADFQKSLTPNDAIELLRDGAMRSASGVVKKTVPKPKLLEGASKGQWPYAAVLSCIDSRAPVEQIFDAQIGDLFVARVAGNVASPDLVASLEYATKYAGSKAILVLGHTKCGAVKGAWAGLQDGHLTGLLSRIQPAVASTKAQRGGEATDANIDACVSANVLETMKELRTVSSIISEQENQGGIKIVGAVYDVANGTVSFLD